MCFDFFSFDLLLKKCINHICLFDKVASMRSVNRRIFSDEANPITVYTLVLATDKLDAELVAEMSR